MSLSLWLSALQLGHTNVVGHFSVLLGHVTYHSLYVISVHAVSMCFLGLAPCASVKQLL